MVTSRDVAREAGVSQATVSRVLSGASAVTETTRERVLRAMTAVGYSPNHAARAMRTGHSRTVGIVVADLENPFYPSMLDALAAAFDRSGYRSIIWVSTTTGNDAALAAIREGSVDGVVFTTATADSSELRSAVERESPLVLVNRPLADVDCDQITSDNVAGGALVAHYFADHDRLPTAFIGGPPTATTSRARLDGFRAALLEHSFTLDEGRIIEDEYSYARGFAAATKLLAGATPPRSLFCSNDLLALGALDAVKAAGLSVPDDLWVVGYDDIAMAGWASFDLTTVRQDVTASADLAARLLIDRIEGPPRASTTTEFEPTLVVRGSTAHTA